VPSASLTSDLGACAPGPPAPPPMDDINVQACACDSLYRSITNFHFAVLQRWLIYDCETECSFVYLIANGIFVRRYFPPKEQDGK